MNLIFSQDLPAFLTEMETALAATEVENNLMLSVLRSLPTVPDLKLADVLMLRNSENAYAIRSPGRFLLLSTGWSPEALSVLASKLKKLSLNLPGVSGPIESAQCLANLCSEKPRLVMDQGLYRLGALSPRPALAGEARVAAFGDWKFLQNWFRDFHAEAFAGEITPVGEFISWGERRMREGLLRLWVVDGQPRAFAGISGQTPNGCRIGPVYTPPEHRRQGFGAALTWDLSQEILNSGKKLCFLYTDLTNPTSNSIYQKIGYRQILRSQQWSFV